MDIGASGPPEPEEGDDIGHPSQNAERQTAVFLDVSPCFLSGFRVG